MKKLLNLAILALISFTFVQSEAANAAEQALLNQIAVANQQMGALQANVCSLRAKYANTPGSGYPFIMPQSVMLANCNN